MHQFVLDGGSAIAGELPVEAVVARVAGKPVHAHGRVAAGISIAIDVVADLGFFCSAQGGATIRKEHEFQIGRHIRRWYFATKYRRHFLEVSETAEIAAVTELCWTTWVSSWAMRRRPVSEPG